MDTLRDTYLALQPELQHNWADRTRAFLGRLSVALAEAPGDLVEEEATLQPLAKQLVTQLTARGTVSLPPQAYDTSEHLVAMYGAG